MWYHMATRVASRILLQQRPIYGDDVAQGYNVNSHMDLMKRRTDGS